MSARRRLARVAASTAMPANADLFEGSPWSLEAARRDRAVRLRVVYPTDFQEALSVAEDLWTRVARNPGLRLHIQGQSALHIECTYAGDDRSVKELLAAVQNHDRYWWSQAAGGEENGKPRPLCLVQDISWCSDTLVIELITRENLMRHVGDDGLWKFQALLARLQTIAQPVVPSSVRVPVADVKSCMAHQGIDCGQGATSQKVPSMGPDYWQQQMRAIKCSMDAGGI